MSILSTPNRLHSTLSKVETNARSNGRPRTRKPKVLFINRVYPPAQGATGNLLRDMAVNLVQRGWSVTVLTGPSGSSDDESFLAGGVRVVRVRGLSATGGLLIQRLLAFLFLYPALFIRALFLGRFDVVVSKTDPPFLNLMAGALGFLFGAKTVHWAQDLYPEVAEALGVLRRRGPVAGLLRFVSTASLRRKDLVIAVGRCMRDRLAARGIDRERIAVVPNWPVHALQPLEHRFNAFRREHDLHGKFVVMYSGNLGRAHTFDPLLDAAREMHEAYPDIQFVIVGDGPRRAYIEKRVENEGLDNVTLLPMQPTGRLSNSLSAGDLHVVTMDEGACGFLVPSKLYGAMAVGRPCLFVGPDESETALFLRENGAGEAVSSADGSALALRILGWYQSDVRRRMAGSRAYRAVRLLRANALIEFDDLLRGLFPDPVEEPIPTLTPARREAEALAA